MLRAAAQGAISAGGSRSARNAGVKAAARVWARDFGDKARAGSMVGAGHHHVVGRQQQQQQQQQQQRWVTNSGRSHGWARATGIPTREGNQDVLATRPGLERHGTSAAMLTTRLRGMFSDNGNGPWWLAVHLLEKGRQNGIKDVKVYNTVLKATTDERMTEDKLKEMERLFEQMTEDDELEPEALTYNHLIYGYSQGRKEGEAVRLLEEMTVKGLQPERKTLSSMIVAHSWGSVEDMRRVSSEMREKGWTPTRRANSAMIGALRRAEDWEGILDTTRTMLEDGQTMTEAGLVVATKAAANAGNAGFARELLLTHGENKHRPQEQLYVCVSL
ncbi:unnamed protein product, partial [Ectocarpus sp. 8 AP-2014]